MCFEEMKNSFQAKFCSILLAEVSKKERLIQLLNQPVKCTPVGKLY